MTDKQIIIDGIDVSGCEFYLPHSEKCGCIVDDNGNNNLLCREYRDCYYKRMSHTGQEKDIYKNENKELYNQLDQLKAENDEWKKANDCILTTLNVIAEGNKKLRQTLTEIKEICNNNDELKGDFNLVDCDKYKLGKHNLANRILQKISECEV